MRIIVYGVGAIGGVLAGAMALGGREVVGIARGRMLEAVRANGLTLNSHRGTEHVRFDCVGAPDEIDFRPDDAILLTMKGQDTTAALEALRAAGVREHPIFCCQNGVANERTALRYFPNVHGVTVMMPATYLEPGEVTAFSQPRFGVYDIGRFPEGSDADDRALAEALAAGNVAGFVQDDVMASKYGKLLMNLGNILEAALGTGVSSGDLYQRLRAEAEAVLQAAGIPFRDVGSSDPRRQENMQSTKLDGARYVGGSTTQSLTRGAGSVETDYLNGEICLLGRLHGVPTPLNSRATILSAELLAAGEGAGALDLDALEARLTG
ncbi:2-dehydropantoate 2-reductase N-terminal domain-containing protein [Psychromarinibacter sp. C21-152]|uniref:2-dehydropantoate 2-reductase n=1 Tax=Psychromarinibacter sediminicola TaxID=3033385 RepID=A0AAE3T9A1_9RHOB|nr:2-dehydropantoate 2-reductase N-terminal domain-containing protein [Psychromarinibacter sediminicola]MDF0602345.1 2-dehydropantoate 2-reductase N-terminal domain-containing protein [Psychromarinibacter sediminicola]